MSNLHAILTVAVISAVTILLRFLPFWVFRARKTPAFITYLGGVLPCAIIGMLVVFCLRGVSFSESPHGIPEMVSAAVVVLLHAWRRKTLLSIVAGTACYMLLVQLVF